MTATRMLLERLGVLVAENGKVRFDADFLADVRDIETEEQDGSTAPVERFVGAALMVMLDREPSLADTDLDQAADYLGALYLLAAMQNVQRVQSALR